MRTSLTVSTHGNFKIYWKYSIETFLGKYIPRIGIFDAHFKKFKNLTFMEELIPVRTI